MRRVTIDPREVGVVYVTKPSRINNENSIQAIKTTIY